VLVKKPALEKLLSRVGWRTLGRKLSYVRTTARQGWRSAIEVVRLTYYERAGFQWSLSAVAKDHLPAKICTHENKVPKPSRRKTGLPS